MTTYRRKEIIADPATNDFGDKLPVGLEFAKMKTIMEALAILESLRVRPPLFELGQTVATPGALDLADRLGVNINDVLVRHVTGDWGDVCDQDAESNYIAVEHGERILSVYKLGPKKETLWLITEHDRSVTTVLLPEE